MTLPVRALDIEAVKIIEQLPLKPLVLFYQIEEKLLSNNLSPAHEAKLLVIQSELGYFIDQPDDILKYADRAINSGLLEGEWFSRVLVAKARGHYQRREYKQMLSMANAAVKNAQLNKDVVFRVAAMVEQARAYLLLGDSANAKRINLLILKYIEHLPKIFEKAALLERFAVFNRDLKEYQQALKWQQRAIDIYSTLKSSHFLSVAYYNKGRIYADLQDWNLALESMESSYRWALKDENYLNQGFALMRLAEYQAKHGKLALALEYFSKSVEASDQTSSNILQLLVRNKMALFYQSEQKYIEAKQLIEESINLAQLYDLPAHRQEFMEMLAENYYLEKSYKRAYEVLKESKG
jgi:tetratricopeptide (TPR) repeat protein